MADVLLQTKLYRPARSLAQRPFLVPRSHLNHKLDTGLSRKMTLISAPAGFGKTTLVAAWLDELDGKRIGIGWLSLDDNDNDLVRFLSYLVAALQTAVPAIGETAVHLLQSPQPPPPETTLTLLINDISQHDQPLILVLDDYHAITTPAIHQALVFLLDHLPPHLHLLITTRSDPPLPLSRLRARGQVVEIRANDLRFTFNEAGLFFSQVMGLTLSDEELAALEQRTEGWIAGLQLAGLSMQGRDDLSGFIAALTGSHRFILDYLTDEVLERRPKGTRQFLLQTAILDRLCGPLCDAVTGQNRSQAILEQLEQANLFLIPLDEERHWYRYHHLFADVLRSRLQQASASPAEGLAAPAELHHRATVWFEQAGLIDEAIRHALAASDVERAAALVEQNSLIMLQQSEVLLIRAWLEQLPAELVQTRPRLILAHGWVLNFTGDNQAAKQWLAAPQAVTALDTPELPAASRGELALLRAWIARALFEDDDGLAFAQQALNDLPEQQMGLRAGAIQIIGAARFRQGDTLGASQAFAQAATLGGAKEGPYMALNALQDLASIQIRQGHLAQIKQTCQQAMRLATGWGGRMLPAAGMAYIDFGGVLYEQNNLAEASQALTHGIGLLRSSAEHYLLAEGYTILARLQQAGGDQEEAMSVIEQGEVWLNQMHVVDYRSWAFLALGQARLWLGQGNLKAAIRWADNCHWLPEETHLGYHQAVTLVRLRLAQSQGRVQGNLLQEAAEVINRLLAATKAKEWWGYVIELMLLRALLCQAQGNSAAMLNNLEYALSLAEPEGYVRLFVDEGEPMAALLRQARQRGLFPHYLDKLLAVFAIDESKLPTADLLPEPLSERELEVLQLAATGVSNQDIADQLFIALSTVKKHMGNILVKLDTPNRVQAIARARELGLLP
jgi:LuxR family maltose regulon positive regulatory protein